MIVPIIWYSYWLFLRTYVHYSEHLYCGTLFVLVSKKYGVFCICIYSYYMLTHVISCLHLTTFGHCGLPTLYYYISPCLLCCIVVSCCSLIHCVISWRNSSLLLIAFCLHRRWKSSLRRCGKRALITVSLSLSYIVSVSSLFVVYYYTICSNIFLHFFFESLDLCSYIWYYIAIGSYKSNNSYIF